MTAALFAIVLPASLPPETPRDPPADAPAAKAPVAPADGGGDKEAGAASPVPFPHPLITEVLYAVPNSDLGDANQDGTRDAAGDEFVELVNPHEKPIQLFGYTLTDRNPPGKGQLKFTFPAFELPPGGVVVVFNGFQSTWSGVGPVGDAQNAPEGPNEAFHNAFVFTARSESSRTSWANGGDFVLLSDPSTQPVHCVLCGSFKEKVPQALRVETAPVTNKGSVQRTSLAGAFGNHPTATEEPKVAFSPGKFDSAQPTEAGTSKK